jgi:hypothetical protein
MNMTNEQKINYQLQVLEIELTGIIAITRKPNLLFREIYEKRIAYLLSRKNELTTNLGA